MKGKQTNVDKEFLRAVDNGDLDGVKTALKKGADVDVTDNIEQTALMAASRKGDKEIVDLLKKYCKQSRQSISFSLTLLGLGCADLLII